MTRDSEADLPSKIFTLEQANAMLPLVSAIVHDWSQLSQDVIDRRERLASLQTQPHGQIQELYRQEVEQIQEDLNQDTLRLHDFVAELKQLGVEPKNGPEGIVDFPSLLENRVVNLCWKLGERHVTHWHEVDSGFSGRQPLPVSLLFRQSANSAN